MVNRGEGGGGGGGVPVNAFAVFLFFFERHIYETIITVHRADYIRHQRPTENRFFLRYHEGHTQNVAISSFPQVDFNFLQLIWVISLYFTTLISTQFAGRSDMISFDGQ